MKSSDEPKRASRRGTFLIVHGLSEYGARYTEMAAYLSAAGFDVVYWDLPGHGDRRHERPPARCWFESFLQETEERIEAMNHHSKPVILFGHSMGGSIVLKRLQQRGMDRLAGVAVASPFLAPSGWLPKALLSLAAFIAKGLPQVSIPGKNLARNLTSDVAKQREYRKDPAILNRIPLDLFAELHHTGKALQNHPFSGPRSAYFAYGKQDPVCSPKAFRHFLQASHIQEHQIHTWPKARHELAHETIREEFFASLTAWAQSVVKTQGLP